MNRKFCFIVNSCSDSGNTGLFFKKNEALLRGKFPASEVWYSGNPENLTEKINAAAGRCAIIVACGGDGTAQAAAQAAADSGKIMGLLPYGSGNDFAKSIGLKPGRPLEHYLNTLAEMPVSEIDFPAFNHTRFLNTAGIGFDGLAALYAKKLSFIRGKKKYIIAAAAALIRSRAFEAVINIDDGKTISGTFRMLTIANGKAEGGGFRISPGSSNRDGILELILVPAYSKLKLMRSLLRLASGRPLTDSHRRLISFRQAEIRLGCRQQAHLDGEVTEPLQYASVNIGRVKVNVLTPGNSEIFNA